MILDRMGVALVLAAGLAILPGCAGEDQVADQAVQPASAPAEVLTAAALPEVRYYLIADT